MQVKFSVSASDVPRIAKDAVKRFFRGHGPVYSAAIAFDILFAAIPLLFLVFAAASIFVGKNDLPFRQLSQLMGKAFPYGVQVLVPNLKTLMESGVTFGVVGIALLLVSSFSVVATVLLALDCVIGSGGKKNILNGIWFHVLMMVALVIMTASTIVAPHLLDGIAALTSRMPSFIGSAFQAAVHAISDLLFTLLLFAGSLSSYLYLSPRKPRLSHAVPASFLFTASVFAINGVFLSGVKRLARLSVLYGSLFGVICFIYVAYVLSVSYILCGCIIGALESLADEKEKGNLAVGPGESTA